MNPFQPFIRRKLHVFSHFSTKKKKKDDQSLPSNYRPIALLNQIGTVMEHCEHKRRYTYVTVNRILTSLQSGFFQGDSTTNQLISTYHTFFEAVDRDKEVRAVL